MARPARARPAEGGLIRSALLLVCLVIIGLGWLAWKAGVLEINTDKCVNVGDVLPADSVQVEICLPGE